MTTDPLNANPITFKVIFTGVREDIPIEKFRDDCAALLKTTPATIDHICTLRPYVLKNNIRFDQAARYKTAIDQLGGICHLEENSLHVSTPTTAPPPAPADVKLQATPLANTPTSTAALNRSENDTHQSAGKHLLASISQKIAKEIRNFLLLDLPERSIALNFKLPSPSARAKVSSVSNRDLHHAENEPAEFFGLLHSRIKLLNFASLSTGKRLRANRDLIKCFYSPAIKHLVELAKTSGVPETEDRRQSLILISDIASILITSYAMVFATYYQGSRYQYARNRKKTVELAASILELLLLKQRARAVRYQSMDPGDWSVANTVFHVMWAYEDVALPVPIRVSDLTTDGPRAPRTLSDQFVLLQVCAWFDLLRLPTSLQWVIGSYLLKLENAVQVKNDTGALNTHELLVYCYGKQAAETSRLEIAAGPALVLNLQHLVEAMHQDCQGKGKFNTRDGSHVMPRFAHFDPADHYVIRNQFLSRLNAKPESAASSDIQQMDDLRIFVGFSAVFAMLNHRRSAFASEKRLEDSLAKRSAVFAVDGREIRQSLWSFSFQNESMTRFTTTEGKETTAMGIGMLLAYGAGDEVHRPRLAVVSRVVRHSGRVLELDMRFIANFCEPVVIQFDTVKVIGLMVYDHRDGGRWSLAVAPRDVLIGVDKVELHRHQKVIPVTLTAIRDASRDFYLLDTTLTSSQLGFYREPQYPVEAVQQESRRVY